MTTLLLLSSWICAAQPQASEHGVALHGKARVEFATVEEGRKLLAQQDDFLKSLSPLERQIRLKSAEAVSTEQLLRHAQGEVLPWSTEQVRRLSTVIAALRAKLAPLRLSLPKTVLLVHTSGREEAGAAYTRGNAIFLPRGKLAGRDASLQRLLAHELFHVMSRHDGELRRMLYALIGFQPSGNIAMPEELQAIQITNPDAPTIDYYIHIEHEADQLDVVPVLLSKHSTYDAQRAASLFQHLQFRLMAIEKINGKWRPQLREGKPLLIDGADNKSYRAQIGRNTGYIIHPDEILADNFAHLVLKSKNLPTPKLIDDMRRVLTRSD